MVSTIAQAQEETFLPIERNVETEGDALGFASDLDQGLDNLNKRFDAVPGGTETGKLYEFPSTLSSKLPIVGIDIEVGASTSDFYSFLVSKEGYQFLDPDSDAVDFDKPILGPFALYDEKYDQRSKCQLEYARLSTQSLRRDVVVLNVIDFLKRRFLCVSATYSQIPGNSGVNQGENRVPSKHGLMRMPILTFYEVQPISSKTCSLRVFQWLELGGNYASFISKFGNKDCLTKLQNRIKKRFPMP